MKRTTLIGTMGFCLVGWSSACGQTGPENPEQTTSDAGMGGQHPAAGGKMDGTGAVSQAGGSEPVDSGNGGLMGSGGAPPQSAGGAPPHSSGGRAAAEAGAPQTCEGSSRERLCDGGYGGAVDYGPGCDELRSVLSGTTCGDGSAPALSGLCEVAFAELGDRGRALPRRMLECVYEAGGFVDADDAGVFPWEVSKLSDPQGLCSDGITGRYRACAEALEGCARDPVPLLDGGTFGCDEVRARCPEVSERACRSGLDRPCAARRRIHECLSGEGADAAESCLDAFYRCAWGL